MREMKDPEMFITDFKEYFTITSNNEGKNFANDLRMFKDNFADVSRIRLLREIKYVEFEDIKCSVIVEINTLFVQLLNQTIVATEENSGYENRFDCSLKELIHQNNRILICKTDSGLSVVDMILEMVYNHFFKSANTN